MMFQNYALFPHLSVEDNVAFSLKMKGVDRTARLARARALLELVDMAAYGARMPAHSRAASSSAWRSPGRW